jgi:hypothetical protein
MLSATRRPRPDEAPEACITEREWMEIDNEFTVSVMAVAVVICRIVR